MKFKVYNSDGTFSREADVDGIPTFEGDKGLQAVKEVVVAQAANARLATHTFYTADQLPAETCSEILATLHLRRP